MLKEPYRPETKIRPTRADRSLLLRIARKREIPYRQLLEEIIHAYAEMQIKTDIH